MHTVTQTIHTINTYHTSYFVVKKMKPICTYTLPMVLVGFGHDAQGGVRSRGVRQTFLFSALLIRCTI